MKEQRTSFFSPDCGHLTLSSILIRAPILAVHGMVEHRSLSDRRKDLEIQIKLHQKIIHQEHIAIADLSRDLNALSFISKLPTEILAEIFMLLVIDLMAYYATFIHGHQETIPDMDIYEWMAVTRVCRFWRKTALHTPRLWSYIYLGRPSCVKIFLERSAQTPLHIFPCIRGSASCPRTEDHLVNVEDDEFFLTKFACGEILKSVLMKSDRIQSLSLNQYTLELQPNSSRFNLRTPELRRLSLSGVESKCFKEYDFPKLSRLELTGFRAPWSPSSNLTSRPSRYITMACLSKTLLTSNYWNSYPISLNCSS